MTPAPALIRPLPERYVDAAPFDPYDVEQLTPEQERFYTASQWRLMWWKFRRTIWRWSRPAILLLFYVAIVIVEFLAPYSAGSPATPSSSTPRRRPSICSTRAA